MNREEYEHRQKLKKIHERGRRAQMRRELKEAREMYAPKKKRLTTAKFALWYIFASCTVVQFYAMAAMWHFGDLSPLISLIGATVGEVISYCAYAAKSAKENTEGGIVYDAALKAKEEPLGGSEEAKG